MTCPTCGGPRAALDVEALLVRVAVAALKELARGLLPRRLRRASTSVRKPVDGSRDTPVRGGLRR